MKYFGWFVLIFVGITVVATTCNWFSTGVQVINDEFNPAAMLKKYEYFKDLSAAIDKKVADIQMYETEIAGFKVEDKEDKVYFQQRKVELIGIISEYNKLCSDYNSGMAKFNYRFANKGELPATNLEPLPREYKPYINSVTNKQ